VPISITSDLHLQIYVTAHLAISISQAISAKHVLLLVVLPLNPMDKDAYHATISRQTVYIVTIPHANIVNMVIISMEQHVHYAPQCQDVWHAIVPLIVLSVIQLLILTLIQTTEAVCVALTIIWIVIQTIVPNVIKDITVVYHVTSRCHVLPATFR
jgi:hypothetical protein